MTRRLQFIFVRMSPSGLFETIKNPIGLMARSDIRHLQRHIHIAHYRVLVFNIRRK